MRLREINKEIDKQTSILKRSEATYNSQPNKDGPIARMNLMRMEKARQIITTLKRRSYE
jgi:hypothetical protein